jgi:hypothetical protein
VPLLSLALNRRYHVAQKQAGESLRNLKPQLAIKNLKRANLFWRIRERYLVMAKRQIGIRCQALTRLCYKQTSHRFSSSSFC